MKKLIFIILIGTLFSKEIPFEQVAHQKKTRGQALFVSVDLIHLIGETYISLDCSGRGEDKSIIIPNENIKEFSDMLGKYVKWSGLATNTTNAIEKNIYTSYYRGICMIDKYVSVDLAEVNFNFFLLNREKEEKPTSFLKIMTGPYVVSAYDIIEEDFICLGTTSVIELKNYIDNDLAKIQKQMTEEREKIDNLFK